MAEVVSGFGSGIFETYTSFLGVLPSWLQSFVGLFLLVLLVVIYAVLVWHGYRLLARKNIINLDLRKYNKTEHPVFTKLIAASLYFVEYIVILPILIFIGFSLFTILLIFLTENIELGTLLVISAVIVAAIRMTSYYSEDLSKDVAKLLPFTLLGVSILNAGFFDISRVLTHFSVLPQFLGDIPTYLLFIILLEVVLRFFDLLFGVMGLQDESEEEKAQTEEKTPAKKQVQQAPQQQQAQK